MFKHILIALLLLLYVAPSNLIAKSTNKDNKEILWKGFNRVDFKFENKDARLIIPNKPLPGNPWVWQARFPDWHTDSDSILVSEGFHIAYINTNNKYGSPDAVAIWNRFYEHITDKYKLNKKVALAGVSRGGLFVYNWAKKNPEKVICIYAEAPVCDFKSWPGGFGTGKGSKKDWKRLKKEYGFSSDKEAKAYSNNPIDNLKDLAEAKVPVLHMIGLNDIIVPPEENTIKLINRYIKLGGAATVIPCTKGKHNLEGHHFPIETPKIVADFIKYNSLQEMPLKASDYHQMRGGLQNCRIKFEREKKGHVAFLGGSITYNRGWRDSICSYLETRFPDTEFDFIAAGIPSMGSTPGAFRLERDALANGAVDLLFEEAAVNDATNGRTQKEQINGMEGIVRHIRKSNPAADVVIMHFVDPDKMKDYKEGKEPEVIKNHNLVAEHYNVPVINLAKEVTDRIDNGEFTWKDDFKNLHPSPFGQGVYAYSMLQFLDNAFAGHLDDDDKITAHIMPEKLTQSCYDNGSLIDISSIKPTEGWKIDPLWKPKDKTGTRRNYSKVSMLICEKPGGIINLKFRGNAVGIAVAAGPDAGIIEYRIDDSNWQKQNLYTRWSKQLHLPWYYTLASGLTENEHELEIRVAKDKDEQSNGNACRIRYFFINKF
jgi:sialidase-1